MREIEDPLQSHLRGDYNPIPLKEGEEDPFQGMRGHRADTTGGPDPLKDSLSTDSLTDSEMHEREVATTPEAIRRTQELYTIEGADYIVEVKEAIKLGDPERIQQAVEGALFFLEGADFGTDASDYELLKGKGQFDQEALEDVRDMFDSINGSISRPSQGPRSSYVYLALIDGLTKPVREAGRFNNELSKLSSDRAKALEIWEQKRIDSRKKEIEEAKQRGAEIRTSDEELDSSIRREIRGEREMYERWNKLGGVMRRLKNHAEARIEVLDPSFVYRQRFSTEEAKQAQMAGADEFKANNGNWIAFYGGNRLDGETVLYRGTEQEMSKFGHAVSETERAILQIATGEIVIEGMSLKESKEVYIDGFANIEIFRRWANVFLKDEGPAVIDGKPRMDVLLWAWKMSLWKGEISRVAWRVSKDGKYQFARAPLMSDLEQKMFHNDKTRWNEFGWNAIYEETRDYRIIVDLDGYIDVSENPDNPKSRKYRRIGRLIKQKKDADGELIGKSEDLGIMSNEQFDQFVRIQDTDKAPRTKPLRSFSHSGHILNVGKIGGLVKPWQHNERIKGWKNPNKGGNKENKTMYEIWMGESISFADIENFPWVNTDMPSGTEDPGELPSGSVGGWMLNAYIRAPEVRKMERGAPSPDRTFAENLRNWEKIDLITPGKLINGEPANPIAWYAASELNYLGQHPPYDNRKRFKNDNRNFRYIGQPLKRLTSALPHELSNEVSDGDFIANLYIFGAISKAEAEWLIVNFTRHGSNIGKFWEKVEEV